MPSQRRAPDKRRVLPAGTVLSFLLLADQAAAQAPIEVPPVTVTGDRIVPSLTVPSVDDARRDIERTPGGVGLVPSERIRDSKATTVKDALDYVPGVLAQPKYGQEDARLSIRGSGLSRNFHLRGIRIMVDGVPMNLADGGADTQELDPLGVRYIEVFRGANALQWGAASLGGAINYVSPTGRSAPGWLARADGGSFGNAGGQVALGGSAGAWDYWFSPTFSHADGYRQHTERDYLRFNGNLGYRFDEDVETRFFAGINHIRQQIPSSLTRSLAYTDPRATDPSSFLKNTRRDIDSLRLANRTTFRIGDDSVTASAWYHHKVLFHPLSFGVVDNVSDDGGASVRWTGTATVAGLRNDYVVGANLFTGVNVNKTYVNNNGRRGALTNHVDERSTNVELYAENRLYLDPTLAFIVGAQLGHARRSLDDKFLANGDDSGRKIFNSVNPKIGVLWQPRKDWQVFGNVSRASEPPTFAELNPSASPGFANLKPQTSWTAEIGTRGTWRGVGFDLSVYRAWIRNELQLFVVPGSGDGGFALNADRTIHQGVELGIDATLLEGLATATAAAPDKVQARLAYTFSDFRFRDDPVAGDNQIPGAPRHYIRAELRYSHPSGFWFGPNVEWVPQGYYVDNANTKAFRTRAYALLGARAGWTFENGLSLFLDARNLFNKTYVSNTNARPVATTMDQLYNPGDGRAVFVGLEFRW
ncbi:TonB-dependent receptor [Vineibacter terrae]|uniref:TonB-dependent receptor family protein n=1 Tax=Vineibacter terrae TaxID=2586908 RepID=UPI002E34D765|nr:TonB-dependent receptor [Vineibacter terrae]HEX2889800.1 TonB-dependent receptor [Vineibacter terrae]